MKKLIATLSFSLLTAVALSAAPVSVTMANVGDGVTVNFGGQDVYVSPYTLTIDGVSQQAMCIDFNDDITVGQNYQANLTNVTSSDLSKTYLGSSKPTDPYAAYQYDAEAVLFSLITTPGITPAQQTAVQEAAWVVSNFSLYSDVSSSTANTFASFVEQQFPGINGSNYASYLSGFDFSNYEIVSDVNVGTGRTQEFITAAATPEPASMALLGIGLLIAGFASRKRFAKEATL